MRILPSSARLAKRLDPAAAAASTWCRVTGGSWSTASASIAGTATLHSKPTIKIEPMAMPGVHEVVHIEPFIRAFREQGEPPILNSHDMRPVSNLVDRFLFFRCGRVVASLDRDRFDNREFLAHVTGARTRPKHDVCAA